MPARHAFEYAVIRVVPHVGREEFLNVGVVLFARAAGFLGCEIALDADRGYAPRFDVADCEGPGGATRRVLVQVLDQAL